MSGMERPLAKSKWFIYNKGTKEYVSYGFSSKRMATAEALRLNEIAGVPIFAVSPTYCPPPVLTLLQGGKK